MRHIRRKRAPIAGVGINDADYDVVGLRCPYYHRWLSMLQRCYSARLLARNPGYVGCSVVQEWHTFSVFKAWMEKQRWNGKALDKDLRVPGNKIYGPNTCLFVDQQINTLLNTQPNQRGDLPLGVNRYGERFKVTFKKDKKTIHLGVYDSIDTAATAYGEAKASWIEWHAWLEPCLITKAALLRAADHYRRTP